MRKLVNLQINENVALEDGTKASERSFSGANWL